MRYHPDLAASPPLRLILRMEVRPESFPVFLSKRKPTTTSLTDQLKFASDG